jgi:sporulation protein YlmC with PRC-barrel domain
LTQATDPETIEFTIGMVVSCTDGRCGDLRRLIVDPALREVTHLVAEPGHRPGTGRLVPIDRVDSVDDQVRLRCTQAQFEALEQADEVLFTSGSGGQWAIGPSFGFGLGGGLGGMGTGGTGMSPQPFLSDRVPEGEVEVQRGDQVHATDGDIGRVQGVVVNSKDHQVTHILLAEGHFWGQRRVLIPMDAVRSVDDGIRLSLSKGEVADLPPVEPNPS